MKLQRPLLQIFTVIASLGANPFSYGASGDSAPFLLDTRNSSVSAKHTVHTDNRAYLTADIIPGSLRQAIANANPEETVDFGAGLSGGTIILGGMQLTIDKDLAIDASGLNGGVTIDANGSVTGHRVLEIAPGPHTITLDSLTFTGGNASGGGFLNKGGAIFDNNSTLITLKNTTFTGNQALLGSGGAIYSENGTLSLENTTFTANKAINGGAIFVGGGASATLRHVTLAGNSATADGGGIFNENSLTLHNTIVANNTAAGLGPDIRNVGSGITTTGSNLVGNNSNSGLAALLPLIGTNTTPVSALLAPLASYGGPSATMALRDGSPAINAAGGSSLLTDQRGFNRVDASDIGAYESGNAAGYRAWAAEVIAKEQDASFAGNADDDISPNGTEYALGTGVSIADPTSQNNLKVIANASGEIEITFGLNPIAKVDTFWIIERSTDLINYTEIYRYDGPTNTSTPITGVSANVGATSITITDVNPPSPNVFYRFGAQTAP